MFGLGDCLGRLGAVGVHRGVGFLEIPHHQLRDLGFGARHGVDHPVGAFVVGRFRRIGSPDGRLASVDRDFAARPHEDVGREALSFRRVPNRFAAPEPRQADILRVEHGELAPGLPVVEIVVHDPVVVGMQSRGHGVMAREGVGGIDRIYFGIGSRPGERVECRRMAAAGEIPAEGVHRKDYDVLFAVGCADRGLAGRGAACQEDEQQEKRIFFHVRAFLFE